MNHKYEIKCSEKFGRYLVAVKDLKAGETILSDTPFVLGPNSDTALVCFNCYLPLISKFFVCKHCAVAPICPEGGCPQQLSKWHTQSECDYFRSLKLNKGVNAMTMVQNIGSLLVLRALLMEGKDKIAWQEFMQLETHLNERRDTSIWEFCENTVKFVKSLGLLEGKEDGNLVQKVCAAIDVNSFEVRGPVVPAIGCSELLRGVYLRAALMAHDCVGNTHMAIDDNNVLVCHASTDIKKGDPIFNRYTDPLKGTIERQQHMLIGKYFTCTCNRCQDVTEFGTYMSSALCPGCKTGYVSLSKDLWICHSCDSKYQHSDIGSKVQSCAEKLAVINKKDEKALEEYIRNVSLVLAPNHYLLLDAKQRLAGVLRDAINREPRPTKKMMKRKIELCKELLPVLEKISPGICRIKAITLYELHATMVQLAKKLFDGREISGSAYLEANEDTAHLMVSDHRRLWTHVTQVLRQLDYIWDIGEPFNVVKKDMKELQEAEKHLKKSLEMLLLEPAKSPEGELCAKALQEYRALKVSMSGLLLGLHTDDKKIIEVVEKDVTVPKVK